MQEIRSSITTPSINGPTYTPTGPTGLIAAITDDSELVITYVEGLDSSRLTMLKFNRAETAKIRSVFYRDKEARC